MKKLLATGTGRRVRTRLSVNGPVTRARGGLTGKPRLPQPIRTQLRQTRRKQLMKRRSPKTAKAKNTLKFIKVLQRTTRRAAVVAPKNTLTGESHTALDKRFILIGHKMASLPGPTKLTRPPMAPRGYHDGKVKELLGNIASLRSKPKFGAVYRAIHDKQDELISTSSVRGMIVGITSHGAMSKIAEDELVAVFETISRVRFPTSFTGYGLPSERMQHPTSQGKGLYDDPYNTAGLHAALDLERKQEVAMAMEEEAGKRGTTPQEIAYAGLRAAIGYTLNKFVAPPTAKDITLNPNMTSKPTKAELDEVVELRENLKALLVHFGGVQEKGTQPVNAPWARRAQYRSASPQRV